MSTYVSQSSHLSFFALKPIFDNGKIVPGHKEVSKTSFGSIKHVSPVHNCLSFCNCASSVALSISQLYSTLRMLNQGSMNKHVLAKPYIMRSHSHTIQLAKRRASDYSLQMPNFNLITDPFIYDKSCQQDQ